MESREKFKATYRFLVEVVEADGIRTLSERIKKKDFQYLLRTAELWEIGKRNGFENCSIDRAKYILMPVLGELIEVEEEASSSITSIYTIAQNLIIDRINNCVSIEFNEKFVEDIYRKMLCQLESSSVYQWLNVGEGMESGNGRIMNIDTGETTIDIFQKDEMINVRTNTGEVIEFEKSTNNDLSNSEKYLILCDLPKMKNPLTRELVKLYLSMEKGEEREFSIQELKERIGLEDMYDHYGHFKAKVVRKGFEELVEKTGFLMTFEEVKGPANKVKSLIIKNMG